MPTTLPIPNIVHKIWFGPLAIERYISDIVRWKRNNPDYQVKLWWASHLLTAREQETIQMFCADNEIECCDITQKAYADYINLDLVKDWLSLPKSKVGCFHFAAASDIWRWAVLYEEGGHYSDTDITSTGSFPADIEIPSGCYQSYDQDELKRFKKHDPIFGSDFIGATKGHPMASFVNTIQKMIHDVHFTQLSDYILKTQSINLDLFGHVFQTTGQAAPLAFSSVSIKPYIVLTKEHDDRDESKATSGWKTKDTGRIDFEDYDEVVDKHCPFYGTVQVRMDNSYCLDKSQRKSIDGMNYTEIPSRIKTVLNRNPRMTQQVEADWQSLLGTTEYKRVPVKNLMELAKPKAITQSRKAQSLVVKL